jgi:endonuclease-3 related protein
MFAKHGPQGWWPVSLEVKEQRYHPGDYQIPSTRAGRFEICVGAILTQNTAWTNVEKALNNLLVAGILDPEAILALENSTLQVMIRPAGFFVQKSRYLVAMAKWFLENDSLAPVMEGNMLRTNLLACIGVGPETADSILLYAYGKLTFVVDAYTRRVFSALGVLDVSWKYEDIRTLFMNVLPPEVYVYQECHALIVAEVKMMSKRR